MFSPQPPLVSTTQTSAWYGVQALSSIFGGQQIARDARTDGETYRWTVIPLPVQPINAVTLDRLADAVAASLTGRLMDIVDCYRLTVERDGWMDSILRTMAHGLLGMPLAFQGDPEMVSALQNADGTPGDYERMHPEAECAKIFADGIGLGFGLGQYVLMCWRCGGVEWWRITGDTDIHVELEQCKTCRAFRSQRPIGARELFQLCWRDARWLRRDTLTRQWFYNHIGGEVQVTPGDGEWFLFRTVPDIDIWRHGPWTWGCVAAIMARDSRYDALNTSRVCAPTPVFQAITPTAQLTRNQVKEEAKNYGFGNSVTLPHEWNYDIKAAKAEFIDVTGKILDDCTGMWEVGITGNNHGMKAGPGFANMDVYQRVTTRRRAFYAGAWIRQIGAQGLVWWARANYGPTAVCPVGVYDYESPEEKLAKAKADEADGAAIETMARGYGAVGWELEPSYVHERAQRRLVRIRQKTGSPATRKLELGVDAVMACVRGRPALESLGLPTFGDARDEMTLSQLAAGGGVAPALASAAPQAAPPVDVPEPPHGAARLEEDEEGDDDEGDAARLAGEYTAHRLEKCPYHDRKHACPRCGVQRAYGLDPVTGEPQIAWRPMRRAKTSALPI